MSQVFEHKPVMLDEVVELFGPVPPGTVVDATVGGGGHARALLGAHPQLRLLGIDQDEEALAAAADSLGAHADRVTLRRGRFDSMADIVAQANVAPVSGVLFDLGVSSWQLDRGERGFSYRSEAALDMRMDRAQPTTASDVVNCYSERDLVRILVDNGERRWAGRIAKAIISHRPIETTSQLAEIVRTAIPAATRRTGGHPAKKTFQAVRIEVNRELEILPDALKSALELLIPGGRIVVLAYHSGEDRLVKQTLVDASTGGCTCPAALPCVCGARPSVRLLNRGARKPTPFEISINPRAESARLRAAEKLPPESATTL